MISSILRIAADLMENAPGKARKFGKSATRVARDVRDEASDRAEWVRDRASKATERVRDAVSDAFEEESSTAASVGWFVAGVGVGLGVALLVAPASGGETRDRIRQQFSEVVDSLRRGYDEGFGRAQD